VCCGVEYAKKYRGLFVMAKLKLAPHKTTSQYEAEISNFFQSNPGVLSESFSVFIEEKGKAGGVAKTTQAIEPSRKGDPIRAAVQVASSVVHEQQGKVVANVEVEFEGADITQATSGEEVQFSADSEKADLWMRDKYGDQTISFSDLSSAADFAKEAEAAGFRIRHL
jgi:hypothetical protein